MRGKELEGARIAMDIHQTEGWEKKWSLFIIYSVRVFLKPLYHLACLCCDQMIVLSIRTGGVWKPTAVAALPFPFKLEKPQNDS